MVLPLATTITAAPAAIYCYIKCVPLVSISYATTVYWLPIPLYVLLLVSKARAHMLLMRFTVNLRYTRPQCIHSITHVTAVSVVSRASSCHALQQAAPGSCHMCS
jgi:hypothetical protein